MGYLTYMRKNISINFTNDIDGDFRNCEETESDSVTKLNRPQPVNLSMIEMSEYSV